MTDERRKIKIIVIVAAIGFLGLAIWIVLRWQYKDYSNMVIISNMDECATKVEWAMKKEVFSTLHQYIESQNGLNHHDTLSTYEGVIRQNTCILKDYKNEQGKVVSTAVKFILDIEELQYSYQVQFDYIKPGSDRSEYVDLGSTQVSCLRDKEMIYPGFKCDENELILGVNGSAIDWEIFSAAPYVGDGFTITYTLSPESVSGYSIVLKYTPPESVFKNGTLDSYLAERRKIAEDYLKSKGVNLDEYSIIESKKYW